MTFDQFAEYLEKLEQTSSRLILMDILAELFSKLKPSEIAWAVYLIQSRVAPFYEPIEIGMADKTVAAAIARAFDCQREKVLETYGSLGDLGLVAQKRSSELGVSAKGGPAFGWRGSGLKIKDVFKILGGIAETTGEGTVEKKISALADLLKQVEPISAKHLVRIPLGVSRLGVGDPTILEGFAKAKFGNRDNKIILEAAYNRTSDLGLIGEILFTKGLPAVEALGVAVGRPIRPELPERLPDAQTILEKFAGQAHVQFKYDGFRVEIHLDRSWEKGKQVRFFSRNLEETTLMFPELVEGVLKQVKAETAILDSEALAYNPISEEFLPFQETTKRRRKYGIGEMSKVLPLRAFVFDIMYLNGKSLIDLPLAERINILSQTVAGDEVLIPEPGEITSSVERIEELFNDALTKGLEGLLVKRPDSKYEAGARNFNWVKLKRHSAGELKDTIDCVVLGYIYGKGKRAEFGAGALLVGVYDQEKDEFVTVSKIGTGLTDEEWKQVYSRAEKIKLDHKPARVNSLIVPSVWIKPEMVIEVLADEITRSPIHTAGKVGNEPGYALRFPRLVRFREADKKAEDATTVKELIEMYGLQSKT